MRVIAVRLWTLALVKIVVLLVMRHCMLMHWHTRLRSLILHADCWAESGAGLNVQNRVLDIGRFRRPRVLRNFLVLRNWTTCVINRWWKHYWLLKIRVSLLLLLLRRRWHVAPVLAGLTSLVHRSWLAHALRVLQLLLSLCRLLRLILIYLSVLTTAVRHFQICCPHICSPPVYMTHLHFRNQQVRHLLVEVTNKTKASTGFS